MCWSQKATHLECVSARKCGQGAPTSPHHRGALEVQYIWRCDFGFSCNLFTAAEADLKRQKKLLDVFCKREEISSSRLGRDDNLRPMYSTKVNHSTFSMSVRRKLMNGFGWELPRLTEGILVFNWLIYGARLERSSRLVTWQLRPSGVAEEDLDKFEKFSGEDVGCGVYRWQ